ncbi:unnamed protein product (macronuclear) [Paramecium tetraurelia]|uniref:Uncharacterized protein n=1 Tax=Paramecium tetraurelia TaxID=5888 RepID=A0DIZ3_PARTE|nr:uncharacterized protein GSPATT00017367001 [Paramecium tetraurelia]CAK83010.1 unnamed protein product [Paramecium tetraurelia]|eukprot:XP_001450407.1 hypothetical protein (macronuclear) [Paramecium tetraurelia strain d4-2]
MIFPTEPYIKKKFFYKNMLADNSKIDFLNQYKVLQQMKDNHSSKNKQHIHTQGTQVSLYKPMFSIHSPQSSQTINKSERPGFSSVRRFHTHNSQQTILSKPVLETPQIESRKERRAPLHKRKLVLKQTSLDIIEYLEFLKCQKKSNNSIKYSDLLKEDGQIITMNQQKQQNYRKQKEEQRNYLQLLYQCTNLVSRIQDGNKFQDIVNSCTHQYPNLKHTIDQLMQDIEVASQIYTSLTQLGAILGRIAGVDHKIFYLMFRPRGEYPESNQYYSVDEDLCRNYKFIKPTKYDIYYRIFGAGDLPVEFQDQLGESAPQIKRHKIRHSEYQYAQLNQEALPSIDYDFVKKISYYQKNLQLFLKQKSGDILTNIRQSMMDEEIKNSTLLRNTILSKLIDSENQIGHFPLVTRQNRYLFEKFEYDQRILNKQKN